jgi:hypothetical protein
MPVCQATGRERLPRVIPPEHRRPVQGFSSDDSRCGLLSVSRQRRTACGVHPVGSVQHVFAGVSVSGAVAPPPGERFCWVLPSWHADLCPLVRDGCAQAYPDRLHILLLEHRGAHTAPRLRWPHHVRGVWWPPSGPELNPSEWGWRALKAEGVWVPCAARTSQLEDVARLLQAYDAPTRQALPSDTSLVEALTALDT